MRVAALMLGRGAVRISSTLRTAFPRAEAALHQAFTREPDWRGRAALADAHVQVSVAALQALARAVRSDRLGP